MRSVNPWDPNPWDFPAPISLLGPFPAQRMPLLDGPALVRPLFVQVPDLISPQLSGQYRYPMMDSGNFRGESEAGHSPVSLPPPFAGITSPTFVRQVPPNVLPLLRFPPDVPPRRGPQSAIFNPYVSIPYKATFAPLFEDLLLENSVSDDVNKQEVINEFRNMPLEEQLAQFMFARTISVEQVRIRWQLVMDIMFLLRTKFPDCQIHAFGSLLSGLGDATSDIDIYADLAGPSAPKSISPQGSLEHTKIIFRDKQTNCPHTGRPFYTGQLVPISKAKVPILRFTHSASRVTCDISFENRISVQNSRLVILFTNMDPRVFRFLVLIRYWLKFHNISGSHDIKNYALTLLGLTYLMRKKIVPTIQLLQHLKAIQRIEQEIDGNPDEIDGWDTSFCDDLNHILQHFKPAPLPPDFSENSAKHIILMALDFFRYCSSLDFGATVVCPLLGECFLKTTFLPGNESLLTDQLSRYRIFVRKNPRERLKIRAPLCIQDPFVLNRNVNSEGPLHSAIKFQLACVKTAEVLSKMIENEEPISLLDLFHPVPMNLKSLAKLYRTGIKKQQLQRQILSSLGMSAELEMLHEKYKNEVEQKNEFCKLPEHLVGLDKVMTESGYQAWLRDYKHNDVLQMLIHNQITKEFFDEVYLSGLLQPFEAVDDLYNERLKLVNRLSGLWKHFTLDFLRVFIEDALKLSLLQGKLREAEGPHCIAGVEELYGIERYQFWKVPEKHGFKGRNDPEKNKKFESKVTALQELTANEECYYGLLSVNVDYPFWENRPLRLDSWNDGQMKVMINRKVVYKNDPIKVEGLISEEVRKIFQQHTEKNRKENKESSEEDAPQPKKRAKLDGFCPFTVDLFVKIATPNMNTKMGRTPRDLMETLECPTLTMTFQSETTGFNPKNAISTFSSMITEIYPEYQLRRFRGWMNKWDGVNDQTDTKTA